MAAPEYPVVPAQTEEEKIKTLSEMLKRPGRFRLFGPDGTLQEIPHTVQELFSQIVTGMSEGKGMTVIPAEKELTTRMAAGLLGMSRQYLVRLLDEGKIPFHRTGTHRRLRLTDVLDYRQKRSQERREAIARIARKEIDERTYDAFILPEPE